MLTAKELDALDLLLWQRSGERAAAWLGCSQSTVSRQIQHVLRLLKLRLLRRAGDWQLQGHREADVEILLLERQLHQQYRLLMGGRLRLEATYWAAAAFLDPIPEGWGVGFRDHVGMERPLQLLSERVIDAWLASYQADLPNDDPEWVVFDLCRLPVMLMADPGHPLSGEALVVRRDVAQHAPIQDLVELLRHRAQVLARQHELVQAVG